MKRVRSGRRGDHKKLRNEYDNDLPEIADVEEPPTQPGNAPLTVERSLVQTMSAEEINDHVLKCLEMSSENKITPKNAFALQLIDCLNYLVEEKKDFSTMACSLDAGAKIYSYRVDALHQQVTRLAEEVLMNQRRKNNNDGDEGEETDISKRRLVRKSKGIIASRESIVRNLKGGDPKDNYIKLNGLPGAIISGVRRDQRDLSFTLENRIPFWPDFDNNYKATRAEGFVKLPKIEAVRENRQIACFEGESVHLSQEEEIQNSQESVDHGANKRVEGDQKSSQSDGAIFEVEDCVFDEGINDQEEGGKGDDEIDILSTAMKRLNEEAECGMFPPPTRVEAIKMVFDTASEYHYLDMKHVKYWAGPDFWKRPKGGPTLADNKKQSRRRKKKDPELIDYDREDVDEKWKNMYKKGFKLSKRTVMNWKTTRVTMPKDLNYSMSSFLNLFHMTINKDLMKDESSKSLESKYPLESVYIKEGQIPAESPNDNDHDPWSSPNDVDGKYFGGHSGSSGDGVPFGDRSFDYSLRSCETNRDAHGRGRLIKINVDADNTPGYDDASLVPAPKMVKVNPIQYKSRPIRVDMRHLKDTMLVLIQKNIEDAGTSRQTRFSSLLKELPFHLEKTTAKDLSPAMAFLALLTLANENNLHIESCDNFMDAIIKPDSENDNRLVHPGLEYHHLDNYTRLPKP